MAFVTILKDNKMKKFLKISIVLLVLFAVIQVFRIDKTNPEIIKEQQFHVIENTPDEVLTIMRNACFDCHSNETKYPWYTNIAPVSWIIKNHINEGRAELNFSEWGTYSEGKRTHKLDECIEEVSEGEMPIKGYIVYHNEALLTPKDTFLLFRYWRNVIKTYPENK